VHDVVIVAAAGNSMKEMDLKEIRKRGYLIGVKNCAWLLNADIGISLDRKWATEYGDKLQGKPWLLYRYPGQWSWDGLEQFASTDTDVFSEEKNVLNGNNSGYCAFNLAYQMRPKTVYLFGFDFTGKPYWYGKYPWKSKVKKEGSYISLDWVPYFKKAKKLCDKANIEVVIVGETRITGYPVITFAEFLNRTKEIRA